MARRAGTGTVLAILIVEGAGSTVVVAGDEPDQQAIIGGESSDPGEYAATGALIRGLSYRCTATLIAPDVAITAAHCLADQGWGDFSFTLDANLTDSVDDLIPVLAYHEHPNFEAEGDYNEIGQRNDLGVLILKRPIEGAAVERLEDTDQAFGLSSGSELSLCGYGRDAWSSIASAGVKRDAVVFVDSMTTWELQSMDEDPQPCRGDSGGPVFTLTQDGRRLAGVVSRAVGGSRMCATGAIYTRVAPYLEWIGNASLDRDTDGGCAAGGSGSPLLVLLGWLLICRRRAAASRRA